MSFGKKLHINFISAALLVVLASYGGTDDQILPQQFSVAYVESTKTYQDITTYSVSYIANTDAFSEFTTADFQPYLLAYNESQKNEFKSADKSSMNLKASRLNSGFLIQFLNLSKEPFTSII